MGKALESAIRIIKDNYGEGSIMQGNVSFDVDVIPTGCLSIDLASGVGGIPRGRITEVFGKPQSGKSTLALQTVAQAQKLGLNAAYIDVENALDPNYAAALGVDMEKLFISQPDYGEEALEICEILLRSGEINIVIVDSVDALVPKATLEGEMGDKHVANLARLMSQALRKLMALVKKANAVLLFINQTRANIQTTGYGGPQEVTSGGVALRYYTSCRIEVKIIGKLKDDDTQHGNRVKITFLKNKTASPFKETEIDLIFGRGFSVEGDLVETAVKKKIIKQSGAWFSYGDMRLGQGKINTIAMLSEDTNLAGRIRDEILLKEKQTLEK